MSEAFCITFRDGSTRYNMWVWPKDGDLPAVEVSRRDDGEPIWGPPLSAELVDVEVQP